MTGVICKLKKRKTIGVIISEVEGLYQQKLLKGIISECYSLNYDVVIFSTLIKNTGLPEYKIGERNIFNLINFERMDGIIVAADTLAMEYLAEDIEMLLLDKCKCPVLYVDKSSSHYPSVFTNDRNSFELITDHLIEVHSYQNIYCLAGPSSSIPVINSVAGYRDSMIKHRMPMEENLIFYEDLFGQQNIPEFVQRIINGQLKKPEAIVCTSDYIAIELIDILTENGIRVPEDIAVTGYYATDEATIYPTIITTFAPPIVQAGVEAVCELTRLMTGIKPLPSKHRPSRVEGGRSCGCNNVDYLKRSGIVRLKEKSEDHRVLLDSYMSEALTGYRSFDECISQIGNYLYLIKDYTDYYLCLNKNWDGSAHNYSTEKENELQTGYTQEMSLVLAYENTELVSSDVTFATKEMLPDLWEDRAKPKAYYFTPVHFNEHCIGYSVLSYGDKVKSYDIIYRNWSRNVMNALEFNRVHRKLYRSSFRDVLTGIYNRNGLNENLQLIFQDAVNQTKRLLVIMADMDNLKAVNDQYGHKEGDHIIQVVANAFQSYCRGSQICARIGGDEFLVVGVDDMGNNEAEVYMASVNKYIDTYNEMSKKPYRIQISMGAYCDYIKDGSEIKEMIDRADKIMYENKARNKSKEQKE
jgi:diguanylate cyclase (GGDEF)-like protein